MANIDVTDIVVDPDFLDPITILRRTPFVDTFGQNQLQQYGIPSYGCVQPVSGETLQRLPEEFRVANVKSFWVKGQIVADGKCQYPDLLVFKGFQYAVQVIFDWTNWGPGWTEGTCVRQVPAA